jgi:hypothetical protein
LEVRRRFIVSILKLCLLLSYRGIPEADIDGDIKLGILLLLYSQSASTALFQRNLGSMDVIGTVRAPSEGEYAI